MNSQTTSKADTMLIEEQISSLISKYEVKLSYRYRASIITLFEGSPSDRQDVIRFARCTKQYWIAEIKSGSRWESLPFRGLLRDVFAEVHQNFPWYLGLNP